MPTVVVLTVVAAILLLAFVAAASARRRAAPPAPDWEARLAAVRPEVVGQLQRGRRVEAVRIVRAATGLDLQRSMEAADAIAAQGHIDIRPRRRR